MTQLLTLKFGTNKIASAFLKYKYQVKTGDILAGTIIGIERKQVLVNVGLKQAAFLPKDEIFIDHAKNQHEFLAMNKMGEFIVLFYDAQKNKVILSLRQLIYLRLWERLKQIDLKNMILLSSSEKSISAGKLVNFDGLKVFLPAFHLPKYYRRKTIKDRLLNIKILEVKDKKHRIIASSRLAFLKRQSPSLSLGLTQIGCVLAVKPFGIFLNVYGIKCLLHISEIANKKIENINKIYKKGNQIKVKVIYINDSQGKIAISAKQA